MRNLIAAVISCYAITYPIMAAAQERPKVVATFSIIGDMARQVGGEGIDLPVLVGPNSDAHVYDPRPADAIALARADVVLSNGLMFEGFLTRLIEASGTDAQLVELSQGAQILDDPAGGHYHYSGDRAIFHAAPQDPHAWQSLANAQVYAENIADSLCQADAQGCDTYRGNAERYIRELQALDAEIREAIDAIPPERRTVVVAHNAFRYYQDAYGVTFLSPQGVSTESEASAADVAGLIRQIRETGAGAVFGENISDARLIQRIAAEAGLELAGTLYSDALSDPEGEAPDYIQMMRHNTRSITAALQPR